MSFFDTVAHMYSSWASAQHLSSMDSRRLSDLGLDRYDVYAARNMGSAARGKFFDARRNERAANWLR